VKQVGDSSAAKRQAQKENVIIIVLYIENAILVRYTKHGDCLPFPPSHDEKNRQGGSHPFREAGRRGLALCNPYSEFRFVAPALPENEV
jgi:hypothetical protein